MDTHGPAVSSASNNKIRRDDGDHIERRQVGSGQLRVGVLDLDPLGDFVLVSDQGPKKLRINRWLTIRDGS